LYLLKTPRKVLSSTLAFQLKCFKNASNGENIAGVSAKEFFSVEKNRIVILDLNKFFSAWSIVTPRAE